MSEFWFCLKHHRVEPSAGCRSLHRLGPYPSEAAAAQALDTVEQRNEQWDNDPRWNDPDDNPDDEGEDRAGPAGA